MNKLQKQVREMQIKYGLRQEECDYLYKKLRKQFEEGLA